MASRAVDRLSERIMLMQEEAREMLKRSHDLLERAALARFAHQLNGALVALDTTVGCPVCGRQVEPITCAHCGLDACADCQPSAHDKASAPSEDGPGTCPKAPSSCAHLETLPTEDGVRQCVQCEAILSSEPATEGDIVW